MTGSGGFIGIHLNHRLASSGRADTRSADVARKDDLVQLARDWEVQSLVHLAAYGTVLAGRASLPRMLDVTVDALVSLVEVFRPRRVLYASSCAVYGNSRAGGGVPQWSDVHPVSVYGLSKAMAELMLTDWARETGSEALLFRIGNVIGANCRGLITYLVKHAARYPDGEVPARMRGGGRVFRDYVPVEYAARLIELATQSEVPPGSATTLNIGTGRAMSNGEVAEIVREWLAGEGYRLNVVFDDDVAPGEAWAAPLNVEATERFFGVSSPNEEEVRAAIIDGARTNLQVVTEAAAMGQTASR